MVIQLLVFWYWSNLALPNLDNKENYFEWQDTVCRVLLVITSFYLLAIEVSAIYKRKFGYFLAPTKLFNVVTPLLICLNVFRKNIEETSFWTVQSWAAIVIWFRFLLYLRTLSTFSWLLRMLTECIIDMMSFLGVLIIGVIAFADAFQSIERILVI